MMAKANRSKKIISALLVILSLASIFSFAYRNHSSFYETPIDFLIFIHAGDNFKTTGQLYERADNYADKYHPSAAIYKFPPAFQLMLMPLLELPESINAQAFMRLLLTGMYVLSLALLFFYIRHHFKLRAEQTLYFGATLTIIGCWFMPFFESIRWLLTEIPLLLLFIVSFLLLTKNRFSSGTSGALLAYAACAKIYPLFLFGYHLFQSFLHKKSAAIWGFIAGVIGTLALALYFYGIDEHAFYLKNILPVLLNEPITDKWVNLNIEKFLFVTGVIPKVTGSIFPIIRALFVGGLVLCLFSFRQPLAKKEWLVFSLFATTMFFCFPNYWPQYQIYLIIPIAFLSATYIKNNKPFLLAVLLISISTLFVPDLLWKTILNWDLARQGLDIEMVGKESYLYGTNLTLLKYSPATWLFYYLYEYRAVTPVVLWVLQVMQIRKAT